MLHAISKQALVLELIVLDDALAVHHPVFKLTFVNIPVRKIDSTFSFVFYDQKLSVEFRSGHDETQASCVNLAVIGVILS